MKLRPCFFLRTDIADLIRVSLRSEAAHEKIKVGRLNDAAPLIIKEAHFCKVFLTQGNKANIRIIIKWLEYYLRPRKKNYYYF